MSHSSIDKVANAVGNFIEFWGFKKVHGRLWTYIYLSETPLSSRELKELLGISKASLSTTINDLKDYRVILESGQAKYGSEMFIANPNILEAIRTVLKTREQHLILEVNSALLEISKLSKSEMTEIGVSKKRVTNLIKLVKYAQKAVNGLIKLETVFFKSWTTFKNT